MRGLFLRDLRLAFRAGGGFGLALAFFLIVCTLVPFGVGAERDVLGRIAPGILWVAAILACLLSLDRIFALDAEDGSLDLLATSALPLEGAVVVKAAVHWLTTALPLIVAAPLFGLLLHLPGAGTGWLVLSLLVGTPALSMLGAFGASLTVGVRRGGLLLGLLVMPLYIPTLIFGAEVVGRGAQGGTIATPLAFLAGVSLAVCAVMPFATAAALRANLR